MTAPFIFNSVREAIKAGAILDLQDRTEYGYRGYLPMIKDGKRMKAMCFARA